MALIDRCVGVVLAFLGVVSVVEGWTVWSGWDGTGVLPLFVGGLLAVVSLVFLFFPSTESAGEPFTRAEAVHVAIVGGAFGLYMAAMPTLGYALSTWLFLAGVTAYIRRRRFVGTVVWTGGVAIGTYVVFRQLLGMYLPVGIIGL